MARGQRLSRHRRIDSSGERTTPGQHRQRTVAALVGDGLFTMDFACACEVFGYDRSDVASPWYRFLVVSQDPPPIRTSTGFRLPCRGTTAGRRVRSGTLERVGRPPES